MINMIQLVKKLVSGLRAWTVQSYTEANIKNGLQYYARRAWANSAISGAIFSGSSSGAPTAASTRYLYVATGVKGLIVKDRITKHIGEEFTLSIYTNPSINFANEIPITVSNYRGDGLAVPKTIARFSEIPFADVNDVGTIIDDPEHFFGSTATGQAQPGTLGADRERILPSDTPFLVAIQLTSGSSGRFEYFIDWYEGETDLPRKQ